MRVKRMHVKRMHVKRMRVKRMRVKRMRVYTYARDTYARVYMRMYTCACAYCVRSRVRVRHVREYTTAFVWGACVNERAHVYYSRFV